MIGLGSAVIGLVAGVPGVAYVADPLLRAAGKRGRWLRVAKLDALGETAPIAVPVVGEQVDAWTRQPNVRLGMVWLRKQGEQVVALSAECPHLGCKIGFDAAHRRFACPCHKSSFSLDGEKLGGPTPRGMDPLQSRVVDGQIEVRFVRFRAQVKERQEIG